MIKAAATASVTEAASDANTMGVITLRNPVGCASSMAAVPAARLRIARRAVKDEGSAALMEVDVAAWWKAATRQIDVPGTA